MTYLHCPRCRLAIRCRANYMTLINCPRCLAHAAITSALFASPLNAWELLRAAQSRDPSSAEKPRSAREHIVILPRSQQIGAEARGAVREHTDELGAQRTADACLLITELATNAFVHGAGVIRLSIAVRKALARFGIHDDGDGIPRLSACPGEDGGWGLHLVDRVAARWGIEVNTTMVWFELDTAQSVEEPARRL